MKKILAAILFVSLISGLAYSAFVEIGITEMVDGEITALFFDNSSEFVEFRTEFYNIGSIGYKMRVKLETYKDSILLFEGWSREKEMVPGDKKVFENYFAGNEGSYDMKIKIYMGNEIKEYKSFKTVLTKMKEAEDIFKISGFRTYDDFVVFDISSERDVKEVRIIPSHYTNGWIFESGALEEMGANRTRTIILNYEPGIWAESKVRINVVSDRGKYYSSDFFEMKKGMNIARIFYTVLDNVKIMFS